mmetsp:Transcript_5122/g.12569  ORF Transcript_5122/g.12569 Transcript_5122/m.12569 type:complete len:274 (+) Transcript_5122:773-1594(+)
MLVLVQDLQLVVRGQASKEQVTTTASACRLGDGGDDKVLPLGCPDDRVEAVGWQVKDAQVLTLLAAQRIDEQLRLVPCLISCQDREAASLRLPEESADLFCNGHNIDRDALLSDAEDLQVRGESFSSLAEFVDKQAQVVALRLPMHLCLALCPGSGCYLSTGGDLHKCKPCGIVILLQCPYSEHVVPWGPLETLQRLELESCPLSGLVLDDLPIFSVAHHDARLIALRNELAVIAPKKMWKVVTIRCAGRRPALPHDLASQHMVNADSIVIML